MLHEVINEGNGINRSLFTCTIFFSYAMYPPNLTSNIKYFPPREYYSSGRTKTVSRIFQFEGKAGIMIPEAGHFRTSGICKEFLFWRAEDVSPLTLETRF